MRADDSDIKARIADKTSRVLGPDTEPAELERVAEGLLFLLEGVSRPGVDPGRARDEALRSALAVLEALAQKAPLVLVLSDLHWASDDTLELCERLLNRLRNLPFVLVATARPDIETRWTPEPGKYNGITLQLDPLDEAATGELVASPARRRRRPRARHAPARTQRRQPVLHRRARRVHAGVGRHGQHP